MPKLSRSLIALALAAAGTASQGAVYVDLPIADARDHAFDSGLLYVTTDTQLHRYDLSTCTMLPPIALGTRLRGIDVTPNSPWIAIADQTVVAGNVHIYLLDRFGGPPLTVEYPAGPNETGSYMVAWAGDGRLATTGSFYGSGWVSMRRYDPQTGTIGVFSAVRQDTMLAATGDGAFIAMAESNTGNGPVHLWNPVSAQSVAYAQTGWYVFEVAADDVGSRVIAPTYNGAYVYSRNDKSHTFAPVGQIGQYATWGPLSAVVPPGGTQIITADWGWSSANAGLKIYDMKTLALQKRIDAYPFTWGGNRALRQGRLTLSPDTRWVAATTAAGVRLYDLADEPVDRIETFDPAPTTTSCGTLHAFEATTESGAKDRRRFDSEGWELGAGHDETPDGRSRYRMNDSE